MNLTNCPFSTTYQPETQRASVVPLPNLGGPCLIYHIGIYPFGWLMEHGGGSGVSRDFPLGTPCSLLPWSCYCLLRFHRVSMRRGEVLGIMVVDGRVRVAIHCRYCNTGFWIVRNNYRMPLAQGQDPKCKVLGVTTYGTMTDPTISPFCIRTSSINRTRYI